MIPVWIGWDSREHAAYAVADASCRHQGGMPRPLQRDKLETARILTRPMSMRDGRLWDAISDAPCATEFAIARFAAPLLQHSGWCLFTDCDVVFLEPLAQLWALRDDRFAVMVVKHEQAATVGLKMDGQVQTAYPRKNWSSVMLINADHPAWARLTLGVLNGWRGRDLHGFQFLNDSEIGELPAVWNWLVGAQPKPDVPAIAHFTLGGPFLKGWTPRAHDDLWLNMRAALGLDPCP